MGQRYATSQYQGPGDIPLELRRRHRIEPETELEFEDREEGILIRPVKGDRQRLARERVRRALGAATNKELTTDELMALMRGDE